MDKETTEAEKIRLEIYSSGFEQGKFEERERIFGEIEDYLSLMNNPSGTPEYYMISKEDWQVLKEGEK